MSEVCRRKRKCHVIAKDVYLQLDYEDYEDANGDADDDDDIHVDVIYTCGELLFSAWNDASRSET